MDKIYIIGLGPGDIGSLTSDALDRLNSGDNIYLRTEKHPTVEYLKMNNISYIAYDYVYDEEKNFDDVYSFIAKDLIENVHRYGSINYCVPGNPVLAEKTVDMLMKLSSDSSYSIEIIPGMSFIDPILIAVGHNPTEGLKIIDGLNLKGQFVDIDTGNIITQVHNKRVASDVKLYLSDIYGDEYEIYVVNSAGCNDEKVHKISIYELDRLDDISYLTSIYVPRVDKTTDRIYGFMDLLSIMERLRGEDGCPWDIKQTHSSIRECVVEEAYEVVNAIDKDDVDNLCEELGDLLLQVVFHSEIGREDGYFNIWDVTTGICNKLIFRHPHVFQEKKVENCDEIVYNWNEIKYKNKNIENYTQRLKDVPQMPSLMRSYKIQDRAKDVGFDWDEVGGALEKVKEEYYEVKEAIDNYKGGDDGDIEEELGDLLFSVVNVCRFMNVNPEIALNGTINKFIKRFEIMEQESNKLGKDLKEMTLEEMDILWNESKIHKK